MHAALSGRESTWPSERACVAGFAQREVCVCGAVTRVWACVKVRPAPARRGRLFLCAAALAGLKSPKRRKRGATAPWQRVGSSLLHPKTSRRPCWHLRPRDDARKLVPAGRPASEYSRRITHVLYQVGPQCGEGRWSGAAAPARYIAFPRNLGGPGSQRFGRARWAEEARTRAVRLIGVLGPNGWRLRREWKFGRSGGAGSRSGRWLERRVATASKRALYDAHRWSRSLPSDRTPPGRGSARCEAARRERSED